MLEIEEDRNYRRICQKIAKEVGCSWRELVVSFCVGEEGEMLALLDQVPIKEEIFIQSGNLWGDAVTMGPLSQPTWLALAVVADQMIRVTGDIDHCFLEDIRPTEEMMDNRRVFQFFMGS